MRTDYRWVDAGNGVQTWVNILAGKSPEEVAEHWRIKDAAQKKRWDARDARGGWRLAVYHWEHETYKEFQSVKVERDRAGKLLKRLARHFKTTCPTLSYRVRRGGGGHYTPSRWGTPSITLGEEPTLGIVCHEYAHHLDAMRHPDTKQWHGKSFKRELKRVYTFAKRYLPE